jgi:hypothetical protein
MTDLDHLDLIAGRSPAQVAALGAVAPVTP